MRRSESSQYNALSPMLAAAPVGACLRGRAAGRVVGRVAGLVGAIARTGTGQR